jgi:sterol desaturase/sphingolipid hydroxylase (fatty acid hydroxylase superfamily)
LPAPIEWLFVTPSHHRVHHAKNDAYIDKNYGGILIIWDRILGTFEAERDDEPCEFGILAPIDTSNLWEVGTGALRRMLAKVCARHGLRAKLGTVLMPPNWEP